MAAEGTTMTDDNSIDSAACILQRHESRVRSYCRDFPVVLHRAQGHLLWDEMGRRFTDLLCSGGALNYGHNPPPIVEDHIAYLLAGGPVQSLDLYTSAKARFVAAFHQTVLAPRGLDYVMQFPGPAGTLAVEAALKLARKVTGRHNIVAFTRGFHGASLGALAPTSVPIMRQASGVPLCNITVMPFDGLFGDIDTAAVIKGMLTPGSGNDPPAAFLLETVQGAGGLNAASRAWLSTIREIADSVGALVIVDDVQAGCGRTGDFFSFDFAPELRPDMICLSKSLSGMGEPMAMLLIERSLDQWEPGEHSGTFRGNNLAFVGAAAALRYWQDPVFLAQSRKLTQAIRSAVEDIVAEAVSIAGPVATVAGRGAMSGIRFTSADTALAAKRNLFEHHIIAETCGGGSVLKLFPPLTMPLAAWEQTAAALRICVLDAVTPV
jgi:diaminobutyrate-2-oxoglutarate transaminase